jgi:WD40 repeat protein/serine/threonine protein kinase
MKSKLEREERIFEAALEIADTTARAAFVTKACAEDQDLKVRIERLIKNAGEADHFFDVPKLIESNQNNEVRGFVEPKVGDTIGSFRLTEKIGAGGEGVVFAAFQEQPVRRAVALKIIKSGAHGEAALARFFAERQTLAMMEHANIARIYDAGTTEAGVPYFVMELVHGIRITQFADEKRLAIPERIRCFLKICSAAQYAHQKGIIHRDLKPSNILVSVTDESLEPKIIDFGIAETLEGKKAGGEDLLMCPVAGTPAYMSPEQIRGDQDVDTRADVYSLGVLLYEFLTGRTPFEQSFLLQNGYSSMCEIIGTKRPEPPSKRFGIVLTSECQDAAAKRSSDPKRLKRTLEGDLDAITLRCLEKDRDRRYATVRDLAEDLRRFLDDEPVTARVATKTYRVRKFIARNKILVAATAIVFIMLVFGIVAIGNALVRERRSRADAENARQHEKDARLRAEAGELQARRFGYASYLFSAEQAFDLNNRAAARDLLSRCIPKPGELDVRNWEWRHLWEATQSDALRTLANDGSSIFAAEFLADGSVVARDGKFQISFYDENGAQMNRFPANGFGRSLVTDATKRFVAYDDYNKHPILRVYHAFERRVVDEFPSTSRSICLGISPDGGLFAGICEDGKARIWSRKERGTVAEFQCRSHDGWHKGAAAFSPSGDLMVFGQTDGKVTVIETKTFGVVTNFVGSNEGITALSFSPDGGLLATASGFTNTTVIIWNPRNANHVTTLVGHDSWVSSVAFSPDGTKLATASGDQTIRLWDCSTWTQTSLLRGHSGEIYSISFSSDGKRLVTGSKSGEIMVWPSDLVRRADAFTIYPKPIASFAFAKSGEKILLLRRDGGLVLTESHEPFQEDKLGVVGFAGEIGLNQDSTVAAVADDRGDLRIWDLKQKSVLKQFPIEKGTPMNVQFLQRKTESLILVDASKRISSWDMPLWQKSFSWQVDENATALAISPDGLRLACGLNNGTLKLYDLQTGHLHYSQNAHDRVITGVSFTKDGAQLLTGSEDGLVKIWSPNGLLARGILRGHVLAVKSVAWSSDGARIASGSFDRQAVKIWDSLTHQELINLKGAGTFFDKVTFSGDGTILGAINSDGLLHLWSARPQ